MSVSKTATSLHIYIWDVNGQPLTEDTINSLNENILSLLKNAQTNLLAWDTKVE